MTYLSVLILDKETIGPMLVIVEDKAYDSFYKSLSGTKEVLSGYIENDYDTAYRLFYDISEKLDEEGIKGVRGSFSDDLGSIAIDLEYREEKLEKLLDFVKRQIIPIE